MGFAGNTHKGTGKMGTATDRGGGPTQGAEPSRLTAVSEKAVQVQSCQILQSPFLLPQNPQFLTVEIQFIYKHIQIPTDNFQAKLIMSMNCPRARDPWVAISGQLVNTYKNPQR